MGVHDHNNTQLSSAIAIDDPMHNAIINIILFICFSNFYTFKSNECIPFQEMMHTQL